MAGLVCFEGNAGEPHILTENERKAIGHVITLDASARLCYGFTVGDSLYVVTCAHCAIGDTMLFQPLWDSCLDTIVLKSKTSPEYDLAVFERLHPKDQCTAKIGDYNSTKVGDTVSALIFKTLDTLHLMLRPIEGIYGIHVNNKYVEFMEIAGIGPEGTSGSPIFNTQGEIVAIVSRGREVDTVNGQLAYVATAVPLKRIWRLIYPRSSSNE